MVWPRVLFLRSEMTGRRGRRTTRFSPRTQIVSGPRESSKKTASAATWGAVAAAPVRANYSGDSAWEAWWAGGLGSKGYRFFSTSLRRTIDAFNVDVGSNAVRSCYVYRRREIKRRKRLTFIVVENSEGYFTV